ncbi:MAG TPA: hypothetical protein VF099_04725, partial [Ktedonobacterales bacterium]
MLAWSAAGVERKGVVRSAAVPAAKRCSSRHTRFCASIPAGRRWLARRRRYARSRSVASWRIAVASVSLPLLFNL